MARPYRLAEPYPPGQVLVRGCGRRRGWYSRCSGCARGVGRIGRAEAERIGGGGRGRGRARRGRRGGGRCRGARSRRGSGVAEPVPRLALPHGVAGAGNASRTSRCRRQPVRIALPFPTATNATCKHNARYALPSATELEHFCPSYLGPLLRMSGLTCQSTDGALLCGGRTQKFLVQSGAPRRELCSPLVPLARRAKETKWRRVPWRRMFGVGRVGSGDLRG